MSKLVLEKNNELPQGWVLTSIGDIVSLINGRAFKPEDWSNDGLPIVRIQNLNDPDKPFNYYNFEVDKKFLINNGQLLFAWSGTPGTSFGTFIWNRGKAVLNQHIFRVEINEKFQDKKYLLYAINQNLDKYISKAHGTAGLAHITKGMFEEGQIPLPPLNEQKRIVEKIEEVFSKIDFLIESINKTKLQLKQYRQSLLNSAFEGELTSNWRKNNHNVKPSFELIEQIQNNRIKQFELESDKKKQNKLKKNLKISILGQNPRIKSWINVKLENLVYIAGRIGWRGLKADEYTYDGPLFLSAYNLNDGGIVDFNQVNHISNDRYQESSEIQLQNNDILLIKDGAGIGRISIVKNLVQQATVNSSLLVIRSNEAFIPEFLFYFLYGPKLQNIAKQRITGSAIPHLFQRDIKKFQLSLPPLEEQHEIVKIIQNSLTNIIKMDESFSTELSNLRGLKNSILKQAFEGKLVPQDPNDEPAEILLQKIKQEKQLIQKQKPSRSIKNVK